MFQLNVLIIPPPGWGGRSELIGLDAFRFFLTQQYLLFHGDTTADREARPCLYLSAKCVFKENCVTHNKLCEVF